MKKPYPLAELVQRILDPANGLVVFVVDVLQEGQSANFPDDSGKQPCRVFGVVPYEHELSIYPREQSLGPLLGFGKRREERPPVPLVVSARHFQADAGCLKEVRLHLGADVPPYPR